MIQFYHRHQGPTTSTTTEMLTLVQQPIPTPMQILIEHPTPLPKEVTAAPRFHLSPSSAPRTRKRDCVQVEIQLEIPVQAVQVRQQHFITADRDLAELAADQAPERGDPSSPQRLNTLHLSAGLVTITPTAEGAQEMRQRDCAPYHYLVWSGIRSDPGIQTF
jgi:hypothetical protein